MGTTPNVSGASSRPIWRALCSPCHEQVRRLSVVLVALVLTVAVVTAWQQSRPGSYKGWAVGDWLVNYEGGWIRRGLSGHLLLQLSSWLGAYPPLVVFGVKVICSGLYHGVIAWRVLVLPGLRTVHVLVLLSPAALLFPVLDRAGAGRKEILLFCLGAFVLGTKPPGRRGTLLLSAGLAVLVLLHEGLFFFMPLFAVLVCSPAGAGRSLLASASLLLALPAVAFGFTAVFHAPQDTELMCRAIDPEHFAAWCGTAMAAAIDRGLEAALRSNASMVRWYSVPSLLLAVCLACAPWALLLRLEGWRGVGMDSQGGRRLLRALAIAALCQVPLFVLAKDWGRWLAIDFTLLAIWYFALRCRRSVMPTAVVVRRDAIWQVICLVAYLVAMIPWRIPHCCMVGVMPNPAVFK